MLNSSKRDSRSGNRKNKITGKSIDDLFQHSFATKLKKDVSRVFETSEKIQTESKLELDGMIMDVLIMIVPITGKDGNVDTVMVTIRNISDLKAAEKLRMENLALEEASKIKNDFLTGMSHELRTPLNAIIGYSEMLRDHAYGEQNAEQVKKIDVILSCGNSLLGVISDILDLSKIEAGKLEFKVETVKVEDIINDTLPLYMPLADRKRQLISVEVEPELVITTDTIRVKQCLNNLVKNAIKFTPDEGRVLIDARRNNGFIEFTVQDTGRGILPEKIESVFHPFYRVDKHSDDKTGGAGLGLSVIKNLVEMLGGTIRVTSDEGKGSKFSFTVPERINIVTGELLPDDKTQQNGFETEV